MTYQPSFRIEIFDIDTSTRWRTTKKAVIYDAKDIGVEEHANDTGSAYWTLSNDHPQIGELKPLEQHYEIARWSQSRSRWEFVAAGILNNYTSTEYETVFTGLDYKSILNQIYTPITNMTFGSVSPLSTDLSINGVTNAPDVPFKNNSATATTALRYINATALSISSISVTAINGNYATTNNPAIGIYHNATTDATDSYWESPAILFQVKTIWVSDTTSGFQSAPPLKMRLYASPPGAKDSGEPPIGNQGLISEFEVPGDPGNIYNGYEWTADFVLFPQELKKIIQADPGYTFTGLDTLDFADSVVPYQAFPLRNGVTYSFQIYAAVYRSTGNGIWYRSKTGKITGGTDSVQNLAEITLGQEKKDIASLVTSIFNNAKTSTAYSRIQYASLSVSGSTYTSHTTFSPGKPSLNYIADICDLEMGARGDGSKAVFGISKPISSNTYTSYSGNFKLSLQVSSAAITTGPALRYPENIKSYTFDPGYSRVANEITVIPSDRYLTGQTGQGSGGTSILGGSATDGGSLNSYGTIPLIVSKGGFVNAQAAQTEAERILENRKLANSKQVGLRIVTDGIELWDGWDVGDSINVTIQHGLANVNEPFVISGIRWFGQSNGLERLEMDLVQGTYFASSFVAVNRSSTGDQTISSPETSAIGTSYFAPRSR